MKGLIAAIIVVAMAVSGYAQEVKYIDAPEFPGQIYLYGQPRSEDASYEQWYEIQGRG
ncbi:MAG: hypothetical protein IJP86_01730 [Synergistaceae bacterium]|nr:hypothetical protein [Synergistaceae bacterium]